MRTHAKSIMTFERADGKMRIHILARNDGLYEYRGEARFVGDEDEGIYWLETETSGLYASAEDAERGAFDDIPWLRQTRAE